MSTQDPEKRHRDPAEEEDGGWNQHNYGRAEGGDYARGSDGDGRQEPDGRYTRGDYGRSTDDAQGSENREDMTHSHEAERRGNYAQTDDAQQEDGPSGTVATPSKSLPKGKPTLEEAENEGENKA